MIDRASANLLLASSESFLLLADARVLADARQMQEWGQREVKIGAAFTDDPRNVVYWGSKPNIPADKSKWR